MRRSISPALIPSPKRRNSHWPVGPNRRATSSAARISCRSRQPPGTTPPGPAPSPSPSPAFTHAAHARVVATMHRLRRPGCCTTAARSPSFFMSRTGTCWRATPHTSRRRHAAAVGRRKAETARRQFRAIHRDPYRPRIYHRGKRVADGAPPRRASRSPALNPLLSCPVGAARSLHRLLGPFSGQTWRANFYKCADNSSHPH
jgi:hypothetical protein